MEILSHGTRSLLYLFTVNTSETRGILNKLFDKSPENFMGTLKKDTGSVTYIENGEAILEKADIDKSIDIISAKKKTIVLWSSVLNFNLKSGSQGSIELLEAVQDSVSECLYSQVTWIIDYKM